MGIFTKEEKVKFRDEEENLLEKPEREVVSKGVNIRRESKTPVSDKLEREYYKKHPEEKHKTLKKVGRGLKTVDKKIAEYNRNYNMARPRKKHSTRQNYNPFGNMFDTGMTGMSRPPKIKKIPTKTKYYISGGKAYPIAGSSKKKKRKKKQPSLGSGYDIMDNWGFMK